MSLSVLIVIVRTFQASVRSSSVLYVISTRPYVYIRVCITGAKAIVHGAQYKEHALSDGNQLVKSFVRAAKSIHGPTALAAPIGRICLAVMRAIY